MTAVRPETGGIVALKVKVKEVLLGGLLAETVDGCEPGRFNVVQP
jgi:hypothetical protein